jgi:hypothetical protein
LQVPQILGRQLLLPNGYLLLMPTAAEDASKELHRLVIERRTARRGGRGGEMIVRDKVRICMLSVIDVAEVVAAFDRARR